MRLETALQRLTAVAVVLLIANPLAVAAGPEPEHRHRVLISNDDGIASEGIRKLAVAIAEFADVVVVAPAGNESGASQSSRLLRVGARPTAIDMDGVAAYALDATPADCIAFGILVLGKDDPFDLVLSGVNKGGNVGSSYLYSGTIGAAFQALVDGIPAIAVSQDTGRDSFDVSVVFAVEVAKSVLVKPVPAGELLSINVPAGDLQGVRVLPADPQPYNVSFERREDDTGVYYKPAVHPLEQPQAGHDVQSFRDGYITVTPLVLDRNVYDRLGELSQRPFVDAWSGGESSAGE